MLTSSSELSQFLNGVNKLKAQGGRLNNALYLTGLRLLPSCPSAVSPTVLSLCYYKLDQETQAFLRKDQDQGDENTFEALEKTWASLLGQSSDIWASTLAQWATKCLGELSSKYSVKVSKLGLASAAAATSGASKTSVHYLLPLWTTVPAVQCLLNLLTRCLGGFSGLHSNSLSEDKEERCVSLLLETAVKHAPHFDWVVAHVGNTFPETVVHRILAVGLKDFCLYGQAQSKKKKPFNVNNVSKFNSVVGILEHLAASHHQQIQSALHKLVFDIVSKHSILLESEEEEINHDDSEVAAIPFLLYLAARSDKLATALLDNTQNNILLPELAETSIDLIDEWEEKYFNEKDDELLSLIVNLIINCQESSNTRSIITALLDFGGDEKDNLSLDVSKEVKNGSRLIMDVFLSELFQMVHQMEKHDPDPLPILETIFQHRTYFLSRYVLVGDAYQKRSVLTLLSLLSIARGQAVGVEVVEYFLYYAEAPEHLGYMIEFIKDTEVWIPDVVPLAVSQAIRNMSKMSKVDMLKFNENEEPLVTDGGVGRLVENFGRVLHFQSWSEQQQSKGRILSQFGPPIERNIIKLLPCLGYKKYIRSVLKLLSFCPFKVESVPCNIVHSAIHALVHTIFVLIEDREQNFDRDETSEYLAILLQNLITLCSSSVGLGLCHRLILNAALSPRFAPLFGGQLDAEKKLNPGGAASSQNLFVQNLRYGSMPTQPLGISTAFHAGIIGGGKKGLIPTHIYSADVIDVNIYTITLILFKVCHAGSRERSKEACKQLALLMIEKISPDLMYNGLPWPEEDFARETVTMERDLKIAKKFESNPILWKILWGLAESRPALCYCSVLLRALLAVQMNFWQTSVASKASNCPKELALTTRNFMRDNVPSPVAFASNSNDVLHRDFQDYDKYKSYCERLRLILARHIHEKPKEYRNFFVEPPMKRDQESNVAMEY